VREHRPTLVFLSETRQNKKLVESLSKRLGYKSCLPVSLPCKGGGLALWWSEDVKVDLINFSPHHIDVIIQEEKEIKCRSTFVYGEPCGQLRPEF
jgi:hypothetical protein